MINIEVTDKQILFIGLALALTKLFLEFWESKWMLNKSENMFNNLEIPQNSYNLLRKTRYGKSYPIKWSKNLPIKLKNDCTVKPVYNDHRWDPKLVAVVDRWSLFRGNFML